MAGQPDHHRPEFRKGSHVTKTEISVTILGGPRDGYTGIMRVPLEDEAAGWVQAKGVTYRVRRANGVTFLVHPRAQALFWPSTP